MNPARAAGSALKEGYLAIQAEGTPTVVIAQSRNPEPMVFLSKRFACPIGLRALQTPGGRGVMPGNSPANRIFTGASGIPPCDLTTPSPDHTR